MKRVIAFVPFVLAFAGCAMPPDAGRVYDIRDYGARVSDNLMTREIQSAIDACWQAGGGEVRIPAGVYRTGGIRLRSNVTLHLLSGAVLEGSRNPEDYLGYLRDELEPIVEPPVEARPKARSAYPYSRWNNALIRAIGAHHVAIVGDEYSCIDGMNCSDAVGEEGYRGPHAVNMWYCTNVVLRGYTIRNSANWAHAIQNSSDISAERLTVLGGHDGFDIRTCDRVTIERCDFLTGDDAVAGFDDIDVTIRDCTIDSACNGFRFGGTDVLIENCRGVSPASFGHRYRMDKAAQAAGINDGRQTRHNMGSAFCYYCDHRAVIRRPPGNIVVRNCSFANPGVVFYLGFDGKHIWCCNRSLNSIRFENCTFDGVSSTPLKIHGDADEPLEISLRGCRITAAKGAAGAPVADAVNFRRIELEDTVLEGFADPRLVLRNRGTVSVSGGTAVRTEFVVPEPSGGVKVSERWGWNAEDATEILQKALDSGERKIVIDQREGDWITRPLLITNSNVEVVLADGVTVRAKRGEFRGLTDCLVRITGGARNVVLRGEGKATLAMNKKDYLDPKQGYAFSEWRHAVSILNASDVTVRGLTLLSSGGDGVYVNGPRRVTLEDLRCIDHNRQGMSPISVEGMTVRRCEFNDTYGAPPQCGVDMEPNREDNRFVDVVYEDCVFNGNRSHGIDMYFGHFTAKTEPVSITYRRCVSRGNCHYGMSFMTGNAKFVQERGHVRGSVKFEDCVFEKNGLCAARIVNHTENGLDIGFSRCRFDVRGSKAEAAISLYNGQIQRDFGGLRFDGCEILMDKGCQAFSFEGMRGVGIEGRLEGTVTVDEAGVRTPFDLAAFRAKYVPHPELITSFRSAGVDFTALSAPAAKKAQGRFTPAIRQPFVFVQAVPAAGEYVIRFKAKKIRSGRPTAVCGVVNLLDRMGTDLGGFEIPEGESTHVIRAQGANVYRLEISPRNSAVIQVASETPGGALLADRPVHLFHGAGEDFYFRVPAGAKEVLVDLIPEEPGSAKLFDADGKLADEMPMRTSGCVLKGVCKPSGADGIWRLHFPKLAEDFSFQVGGDAVPLLSTERDGVIR